MGHGYLFLAVEFTLSIVSSVALPSSLFATVWRITGDGIVGQALDSRARSPHSLGHQCASITPDGMTTYKIILTAVLSSRMIKTCCSSRLRDCCFFFAFGLAW